MTRPSDEQRRRPPGDASEGTSAAGARPHATGDTAATPPAAVTVPGAPSGPGGDVEPAGDSPTAAGDQAARERIRRALDETLFVEAGAGAGKTRALVERVLALVMSGRARLGAIAAITFTEKAAAELRDRVRTALVEALARARTEGDAEAVARAGQALDDLDGAAIGTLHSFAQRILSEHPVEAGLPPRIEVLDEVASTLAFDDRWTGFVDELLDDRALARPILLLSSVGVRLGVLREIALSFDENWDLVSERAPALAAEIPDWEPRLGRLVDEAEDVARQREHCHEDDDPLCQILDSLADWAQQVRTAPDESARLALCMTEGGRPRASPNGKGAKPRWAADYDLPGLRARVADLLQQCEQLANEVAHAALVRVAVDLRRFTLDCAEERRREGRLEFHDLLVMARQVLRDPDNGPVVRASLADRYQRLLIDEFQDTDPIQVELAVLVASTDPDAGGEPWHAVEPEPGRLFFVGDPKQSIYRFRRADIALFLAAADRFGAGDRRLALTTNHRSGRALVDWFNQTFARLITPAPSPAPAPPQPSPTRSLGTGGSPRATGAQGSPEGDAGGGRSGGAGLRSQPDFVPSVAVRPDPPAGPVVSVLGRQAHTDKPSADDLRAREAAEVAAAVARIVDEGWLVDRSPDWRTPDWQPARAGDVTILLPTRLSLPFLEEALTEAGVAYRAESASLVYGSRLVRDLFLTLRAIDDPSDELCTVAALRSALFGCGDDDLFTFRELHQGSFDHGMPRPETLPPDHPVAQGLAYLEEMHERRRWCSASELVDQVVRDRRLLELAGGDAGGGRARDLWQRVRFVVDQARAWTDTTGGTLRRYLDWVRHQSAPGSRVTEAVLPETDDDAVRIMTVHAAKGLQFPITVLAGLSTYPQVRRAGAQVVWPPAGPCILNVGRRVTSPAYEVWRPLDEQMSHDERIRLLYVACTRARDHLVVSLHRRERAQPVTAQARMTNAELLAEALTPDLDHLPDATPPPPAAPPDEAGPAHAARQHASTTDAAPPPRAPAPGATGTADEDTPTGEATPADAVTATAPDTPDSGSEWTAPALRAVTGGSPAGQPDEVPELLGFEEWAREREGALARSGRPRTVAATALTDEGRPDAEADPGLHKRPGDLDLPPWRKGRYGTAIGRAVHGVLQVIDLASGAGVDEAVAAQAAAEGVVGHERRIRTLVQAALQAPTVVEAAGRSHWREVHVAVPVGDDDPSRTLEGYVDLLYRRDDGLVVVDYKTGPSGPDDEDLDLLVDRYRLQGASYAVAVAEAAGGERVVAVVFVFLTPQGPVERSLPDLDGAVAHARTQIRRGTFTVAG